MAGRPSPSDDPTALVLGSSEISASMYAANPASDA
jgi:hypothetical protein